MGHRPGRGATAPVPGVTPIALCGGWDVHGGGDHTLTVAAMASRRSGRTFPELARSPLSDREPTRSDRVALAQFGRERGQERLLGQPRQVPAAGVVGQ